MPLYSYSARNAKGERLQGTVDATDVTAARMKLAENGLLPEEVFQISFETSASTNFASAPSPAAAVPPVQRAAPPQQKSVVPSPPAKAAVPPAQAQPAQRAPQHQATQAAAPATPPKSPPAPPPASPAQAQPHDWAAESRRTAEQEEAEPRYYPFMDTLRLYAGWLLAWYAIVYALGFYQSTRALPFTIPYLAGIYTSPLVLSCTLAAFLFLFLSAIYSKAGRGTLPAVFFTFVGIVAFVFYRMNV